MEGRQAHDTNVPATVSSVALLDEASRDVVHSVVARRKTPTMYVVDRRAEVALCSADRPELDSETRQTVAALIQSAASERASFGMTADGHLIRVVRLASEAAPHYAVFVEDISERAPLDEAMVRFSLSDRERDVLRHLLRGASTAVIADDLIIGQSTVATHIRNIGSKMNASKRKEIVAAVLGHR